MWLHPYSILPSSTQLVAVKTDDRHIRPWFLLCARCRNLAVRVINYAVIISIYPIPSAPFHDRDTRESLRFEKSKNGHMAQPLVAAIFWSDAFSKSHFVWWTVEIKICGQWSHHFCLKSITLAYAWVHCTDWACALGVPQQIVLCAVQVVRDQTLPKWLKGYWHHFLKASSRYHKNLLYAVHRDDIEQVWSWANSEILYFDIIIPIF